VSSRSAQVAIGTPGRVLDLLGRDALRRDHIRMLVLDEADELLTGGFKDQVSYLPACRHVASIIQYLPARIQVGLFSGAFSSEALETSHWFMDDDKHVTIKVPRGEELKDIGIKQFYFYRRVDSKEEKLGALYGTLLDALEPVARTVVFANTKRGVRTHLMQYISRVQQQRRCSGTGIVLDRRSHLPSLTILIW
jgi:translation initiation factor 4A